MKYLSLLFSSVCLLVFVMVVNTPGRVVAQSGDYFGNATPGASSNGFIDDLYVVRYELTEPGSVFSIGAYLNRSVSGSNPLAKFVIYGDPYSCGAPASPPVGLTYIGETEEITVTSTTGVWYEADFPSPIVLAADCYWIGLIGDQTTTDTVLFFYDDISANAGRSLTYGYENAFPTPTYDPDLGFVRDINVVGNYTPATATPTPVPTATLWTYDGRAKQLTIDWGAGIILAIAVLIVVAIAVFLKVPLFVLLPLGFVFLLLAYYMGAATSALVLSAFVAFIGGIAFKLISSGSSEE